MSEEDKSIAAGLAIVFVPLTAYALWDAYQCGFALEMFGGLAAIVFLTSGWPFALAAFMWGVLGIGQLARILLGIR